MHLSRGEGDWTLGNSLLGPEEVPLLLPLGTSSLSFQNMLSVGSSTHTVDLCLCLYTKVKPIVIITLIPSSKVYSGSSKHFNFAS